MDKIIKGTWGKQADTHWQFFLSDTLPSKIQPSAVMGLPFWKGKIALTHHRQRGWEIPGGHIEDEDNGNLIACLKRELKEETGATKILSKKLFGYKKITNSASKIAKRKKYPRQTIVPYYLVELGAKPIGASTIECSASKLFNIHDPIIANSHDFELILIAFALRPSY